MCFSFDPHQGTCELAGAGGQSLGEHRAQCESPDAQSPRGLPSVQSVMGSAGVYPEHLLC